MLKFTFVFWYVGVRLLILADLLTLTLFVQDGSTALHIVSENGHNKVVVILIAAGANLDFKNKVSL